MQNITIGPNGKYSKKQRKKGKAYNQYIFLQFLVNSNELKMCRFLQFDLAKGPS